MKSKTSKCEESLARSFQERFGREIPTEEQQTKEHERYIRQFRRGWDEHAAIALASSQRKKGRRA